MRPQPDVAIILLTKNALRWLDEVLAGIFGQETRHIIEVIAVDSGSRDGTAEHLRAEAAAGRLRLFEIPPESFHHGRTRNFGASQTSPSVDYLVFLSHDATPAPGWLDALIAPLEADPAVAGAHSRHIPRPTCPPPQARLLVTEWAQSGTPDRVVKRLADLPPGEYERNQHYWAHFSDTASVMRRSVWEEYPIPEVDFAEDAAWADRVLRAGYTLVYEPASAVVHSHDYGLWRQLKQNVDHARAMKERFDPPAYKESHPTRTLAEIVRLWRLDRAYIRGMAVPRWHKPILMFHSPFWHLATHAGIKLGIWWERLPGFIAMRLSHQAAIKRG
ncbi:MAG: glycosyltransferase [Ardenticatenaceae bacterium]|nr:glycosyltransferase [Ardenticatenaceae bacterium]